MDMTLREFQQRLMALSSQGGPRYTFTLYRDGSGNFTQYDGTKAMSFNNIDKAIEWVQAQGNKAPDPLDEVIALQEEVLEELKRKREERREA